MCIKKKNIYLHNVLLYLDDGEGMKHHKVWPVHACTCFERGVFPERPDERGYCKGKFLHTQTTSPKQSLTTMIRDMSVVAKLMQMVSQHSRFCLWMEGWITWIFSVHFFGWNFRPRVQDVEWTTNRPEHPSPTSHHPFLASTGAGMSPERRGSHNLFYPNIFEAYFYNINNINQIPFKVTLARF